MISNHSPRVQVLQETAPNTSDAEPFPQKVRRNCEQPLDDAASLVYVRYVCMGNQGRQRGHSNMKNKELGQVTGTKLTRRRQIRDTPTRATQGGKNNQADPKQDKPSPARRPLPALTHSQQQLVNQHIGLIRLHLRNRVPTPQEPQRNREYEDLFQEGCVALVRAASRYQPDRHGSFPTYALPRIRGAIHAALTEKFSMVHVPTRARLAAAHSKEAEPGWPTVFEGLDDALQIASPTKSCTLESQGTIRHALRQRYEMATRHALADLQSRTWPRRDPSPIMARIAAEHLFIAEESQRTPLRQIARECNISSGRIGDYTQKLKEVMKQHFQADAQVPLLIRFAREDSDGFDGILESQRQEEILQAELDDFESRFAELSTPARAELTYRLIEQSTPAVTEVVRNLYWLSLSETTESLLAPPMSA